MATREAREDATRTARERALAWVRTLPAASLHGSVEEHLEAVLATMAPWLAGDDEIECEPGQAFVVETIELRERFREHIAARIAKVGSRELRGTSVLVPRDCSHAEMQLVHLLEPHLLERMPEIKRPKKRALICEWFRFRPQLGDKNDPRPYLGKDDPTLQLLAAISVLSGASEADGNSGSDLLENEARALKFAWESYGKPGVVSPYEAKLTKELAALERKSRR